jgi:arylsulfatase A-like enzyme
MPGAPIGLKPEDPTIAQALKHHGYATGQFGKNHLVSWRHGARGVTGGRAGGCQGLGTRAEASNPGNVFAWGSEAPRFKGRTVRAGC